MKLLEIKILTTVLLINEMKNLNNYSNNHQNTFSTSIKFLNDVCHLCEVLKTEIQLSL
jgi:hypothetical protein